MKLAVTLLLCAQALAAAQTPWRPAILGNVGIDQKMGAQVPLDVPFADEEGRLVTLRQYLGKPVILALVYYQCPSLCNMVLNGLTRSAKSLPLAAGRDFQIVAVSFDARETPTMAKAKRAAYLRSYNRAGSEQGWHFLTGSGPSSKTLADAVGFHFAYDPMTNQFAHGSAIILLTPDGRVTRYFYGVEYPERDLRLSLIEASNGRIGSAVDQVLLYCYHYDPSSGKYGMLIMNVLRLGGLLTVGVLGLFVVVSLFRDHREQGAA